MSGLDRVRPRTPDAPAVPSVTEVRDQDGKRALFSVAAGPQTTGFGSVTIDCASCGEQSVLSPWQGLRAALPSLHLPVLRRDHASYLRCPACERFSWTRLSVRL